MERVTIIGLGLIGGSLGMALNREELSEIEIVGYDEDRKAVSRATKLKAIDRGERDVYHAVRGAQIVIIATPILAIQQVMKEIGPQLGAGCVVTDTGSTKVQIMAWADEYLPSSVDFVGGHPMAGKEVSGIENADPDLFVDATYCIIPSSRASSRAVNLVNGLVERVGAVPFFPSAEEHDGLVAGISHLPLIISSALISATANSASWRELYKLAASGFTDATRLASSDPVMSADICLTNQEAIRHWIDRLIAQLEDYKKLIGDGGEELQNSLINSQMARDRWVRGEDVWPEGKEGPEIPTLGQQLAGMFMGEKLAKRSKQLFDLQMKRMREAGEVDRDEKRDRKGKE
ncbi:MAG: prephenate dehydrogenase [Dehalococcoidia bacterium]